MGSHKRLAYFSTGLTTALKAALFALRCVDFTWGKNDTILFALLMTSMMCDLTKSTFQCTQRKVTKYNNQLGNGKKNRYFVRNLDDATYLTLVTNRDIYQHETSAEYTCALHDLKLLDLKLVEFSEHMMIIQSWNY